MSNKWSSTHLQDTAARRVTGEPHKIPAARLAAIVEQVIEDRGLQGQKAQLLRLFVDYYGMVVNSSTLADEMNRLHRWKTTRVSVSVQILGLRKKIKGTGLLIDTFHGAGGGLTLEWCGE